MAILDCSLKTMVRKIKIKGEHIKRKKTFKI